jgi:uncharacterized membrane protein
MKPRHAETSAEISNPRAATDAIPARRSAVSVPDNKGVKVEECITINRSPAELFAFWRNFENLPRIMEHVESVECLDQGRSRWRVRGPGDKLVEWESDVINEHPNELIAWRTLEGSDVQHAGSVRFTQIGSGATEVKVAMEYETTKFAHFVAKLFGRSPEQQIAEELRRFKQLMETGEVSDIGGDPRGRSIMVENRGEAM